jgi:GAF domain-containing protein/HAMP domain-containing protein
MESSDEGTSTAARAALPQPAIRRGGLTRTLLVAFLPLVVGPLIVLGVVGVVASTQTAVTRVANQLELVANLKEREISRWLRERDRDLAVLGSEPALLEDAATLLDETSSDEGRFAAYSRLGIRLDDFLGKKLSFAELFLLDAENGQTVVSTDVLQEGILQGKADFFQQGLQGPYLRAPEFDPRLNVPTMLIARPLPAEGGRVVGVLVGRVNLGDLSVLMLERTGLGETGETYLVDQELRAVTRLRFEQAGLRVETEGTRQSLARQAAGADRYDNYQGEPVFGVYRWIPELQVALLAEQAEEEALGTARFLQWGLLGLTVAGGMFAALVVILISRRTAAPIRRLTEVATQMAAGDLSQRAAVQRHDEIGALGQAFDGMADQVAGLIGTLEQRVADRTHDLERRAVQLATAAGVGRVVASILELEPLAREVVDLVRERFDLYYVGLFLLDEANRYAVLEAGTGEAGRTMKEQEHSLEVGGVSMVGAACAYRQARIALDVGAEPVRFDNPLLPDTRSEMALPLMVGDRVLGGLDVQSTRPGAFSEEDIAVLQLVADQVAVAVDNAHKFSEEAALLEATSPLFRASRRVAAATTTEEVIQATLASVAETEADGCTVALFGGGAADQREGFTLLGGWDRQDTFPLSIGVPYPRDGDRFPLRMVQSFWAIEDISEGAQMPEQARQFLMQFGHPALVNVPLRAAGRVVGFVLAYRTTPGPFSPVSIRLYVTLADQTAVALERAQLLEETQRRAARERLIREVTGRMHETLDVDTVLRTGAQEIRQALGLSSMTILLAAPADKQVPTEERTP